MCTKEKNWAEKKCKLIEKASWRRSFLSSMGTSEGSGSVKNHTKQYGQEKGS